MGAAILGVDPGASGALAILDHDGAIIAIEDMPAATGAALGACIRTLLDDIAPWQIERAWIEGAAARPGQSAPATWKQAANHGGILAALGALSIPVEIVQTPTWRKTHGITIPATVAKADKRKHGKQMSRQKAMELWPADAHLFRRVKDDGRAEAALLAEHGRRTR